MNPVLNAKKPVQAHQRKIHYIDQALQKWLLIALVALEVIILALAGAVLYYRLDTLVEDSLYRVHLGGQPSMLSILLKESILIIAGLVFINILALLIADRLWARQVRRILVDLKHILVSVKDLDLREEVVAEITPSHKILSTALQWHQEERARHHALTGSISEIQRLTDTPDTTEAQFRASLLAFCHELPVSTTQSPCPEV